MNGKRGGGSSYNPEDAIEDRNNQMLGELQSKTEQWKGMAMKMKAMFTEDLDQLEALSANMETGGNMISKSRHLISSIVDDPTYLGVFKIAMLVFVSLCILYFGPKIIYKLFSK